MNIESYKNKYGRYINFIKKYSKAINASTGSEVDSNANVDNKNVTTCTGELYKRDAIGINRLRMINKLTELYGEDTAKEYIRQLESHEIYRHDETNPCLPYTYSSQEVVLVKYKDKTLLVRMERLYELCEEPEFLVDSERIVYCKKPEDMWVKDRDGFTEVKNLFKKKRHKNLVNVRTKYNSIIVTEDHPMIVSDDFEDTVPANESKGKSMLTFNKFDIPFDGFAYSSDGDDYEAGKLMAETALYGSKREKETAKKLIENAFHYNKDFANGIADYIETHRTEQIPRSLWYSYAYIAKTVKTYNLDTSEWDNINSVQYTTEDINKENDWIYDISTQSHTFVCNGFWVHNCVSITMYPYLFAGTTSIGGNSEAPKHLDSFCGSFINLVYAIAAQFAGAIATPEFLMYMDYFIRKDYGDDYYLHPEKVVSFGVKEKTLENLIENKFQQVVYTINDPAGSRNFQSVK